jgi:hypothetical protein
MAFITPSDEIGTTTSGCVGLWFNATNARGPKQNARPLLTGRLELWVAGSSPAKT